MIFKEDRVGGRARVTVDEERVRCYKLVVESGILDDVSERRHYARDRKS